MEFELGFGTCTQRLDVPDENLICVLLPNPVNHDLMGTDEVARALQNPIGTPRVGEIVRPGETVAIVTSDITRPLPSYQINPFLRKSAMNGTNSSSLSIVSILPSSAKNFGYCCFFIF